MKNTMSIKFAASFQSFSFKYFHEPVEPIEVVLSVFPPVVVVDPLVPSAVVAEEPTDVVEIP